MKTDPPSISPSPPGGKAQQPIAALPAAPTAGIKADGLASAPESSAATLASGASYHANLSSDISKVCSLGPGSWSVERLRKALNVSDRGRFDQIRPEQQAMLVAIANGFPEQSGKVPPPLVQLLASDKIFSKDLRGGSLLDTLAKLSTQDMADGLDRATIMTEVIERVVSPEKIAQRNKGTCTVTSLEYLLASKHPAEFARVVAGLVSKEGVVKLADGKRITREASGLATDDSRRSSVDRIFQSTMMETFNGNYTDYDNTSDTNSRFGWFDVGAGLNKDDFDDAVDSALGTNYQVQAYGDSANSRKKLLERFKKALSAGHPVPIGMFWAPDKDDQHASHKLILTGVSDSTVELWNPWGDGETGNPKTGPPRELNTARGSGHLRMSAEDFFSRLRNFHLPPNC